MISKKRAQRIADEKGVEFDDWGDEVIEKEEVTPRKFLTLKRATNLSSQTISLKPSKTPIFSDDAGGTKNHPVEGVVRGLEGGIIGGEERGSVRGKGGGEERGGGKGEGVNQPMSIMGSLIEAAAINRAKKQARAAKRATKIPATPDLSKLWNRLVPEKFPGCITPAWDVAHRVSAKRISLQIGVDSIKELVEWSIENWTAVMSAYFAPWWTKGKLPSEPAFLFFAKMVDKFKQAKEESKDKPMQVSELVRGLNLAKKVAPSRSTTSLPNTSPQTVLPKKDLGVSVSTVFRKQVWKD